MSPVRESLEASLVRIHTADGRVVGAGFLVGERQILTCAHVISQALGLVNHPLDPPQGLVSLDFPLLPPRTLCTAKVALWYPPLPDGRGDIAGLELHREPPAGAEMVRFASAEDVWEHPFRVFGFPRGYDDGVWATGRLLGRQATDWIMIEYVAVQGFGITPGFSGTPVWDTQLQGVVGMVVAIGRPAETKAAFVIPVDVLVAAWPLTRQRVFLSATPADNSFPKSLITAEQTIKDTVEKPQDIVKDATFIYGPVQGFVQGEHNTVTLIFQDSKVHTMPFLAPPQPPYNLVGRDELIRELKQQLFHGGNLALSALNGLPGVGKTALALAIAHDREVLGHFCDGVLWAGLGRESNVFSYLGMWGMALGIPQSEMGKLTSLTMLTETIHRAIGTSRMLLVVDDAWSPEDALAFKLGGPYCAHIVTTRLPEVAERFASEGAITVRELDEDDSLRLLEKLAPGVSAKAPDEVREIIQAVDGLPLSLILMGNYVRIQMKTKQPRRLRTALDRLLRVKERLQLEQPQGGLERHPSLPEGIPLSQLAVIKISDEALDQETQQVLRSLSVFPSKPNTFSEEAALAVAATNPQVIDTLHDFGLLESSRPARYTLHQTISDYAQINLSDPTTYERMVAFFIEYVQAHKADRDLLERETNNILAAVEIMLERGMHPAGASAFAHFIRIVRRTRAI